MKIYLKKFLLGQVTPIFALACFAFLPRAQAACLDGCNNGLFNVWQGDDALLNDTTGAGNSAFGWRALFSDSTGSFNTGVGGGALALNNADSNTAVGAAALLLNTTGSNNTAVGTDTLVFNDSGSENTAVGNFALNLNATGTGNTAMGQSALESNTTGSGNLALGIGAGSSQNTGNNNIYIGQNILGVAGENDTCYIGSIFGQTSAGGAQVLINSSNKLGTMTSSKRFKEEITPMDKTSEALFALKPVTFHYKKEVDPARTPQFGLVAEDVEKVNPDLVVRDKKGKPYSVRYDQINTMLLNEFLKEHRKNEEQQALIERQQRQIEALTAGLQKVSAQLEASKPAPRTVLNNQ